MKSRAKNLGLVGVILGSSVFSGCVGVNDNSILGAGLSALGVHKGNPVAQVIGGQLANYGAAQVGRSQTNVYVNVENGIAGVPKARSFVFSKWVDNGDGCFDLDEAQGIGKSVFFKDETVTYAVEQYNCKGRTLRLYNQSTPDSPLKLFMIAPIERDSSFPQTVAIPLYRTTPGVYRSYWTLDDVKIGEHLIEVKAGN